MFRIEPALEEQITEAKRHLHYFTNQTLYMLDRKIHWGIEVDRLERLKAHAESEGIYFE